MKPNPHRVYKVEMRGRPCAGEDCERYVNGFLDYCPSCRKGTVDFNAYASLSQWVAHQGYSARAITAELHHAYREVHRALNSGGTYKVDISKITKELDSEAMKEVVKTVGEIMNRVQSGSIDIDQGHIELIACKHVLQSFAIDLARQQFKKQGAILANGKILAHSGKSK